MELKRRHSPQPKSAWDIVPALAGNYNLPPTVVSGFKANAARLAPTRLRKVVQADFAVLPNDIPLKRHPNPQKDAILRETDIVGALYKLNLNPELYAYALTGQLKNPQLLRHDKSPGIRALRSLAGATAVGLPIALETLLIQTYIEPRTLQTVMGISTLLAGFVEASMLGYTLGPGATRIPIEPEPSLARYATCLSMVNKKFHEKYQQTMIGSAKEKLSSDELKQHQQAADILLYAAAASDPHAALRLTAMYASAEKFQAVSQNLPPEIIKELQPLRDKIVGENDGGIRNQNDKITQYVDSLQIPEMIRLIINVYPGYFTAENCRVFANQPNPAAQELSQNEFDMIGAINPSAADVLMALGKRKVPPYQVTKHVLAPLKVQTANNAIQNQVRDYAYAIIHHADIASLDVADIRDLRKELASADVFKGTALLPQPAFDYLKKIANSTVTNPNVKREVISLIVDITEAMIGKVLGAEKLDGNPDVSKLITLITDATEMIPSMFDFFKQQSSQQREGHLTPFLEPTRRKKFENMLDLAFINGTTHIQGYYGDPTKDENPFPASPSRATYLRIQAINGVVTTGLRQILGDFFVGTHKKQITTSIKGSEITVQSYGLFDLPRLFTTRVDEIQASRRTFQPRQ